MKGVITMKSSKKYKTLEELQQILAILEKHLSWYREHGYTK
jgi:hypothetical protein